MPRRLDRSPDRSEAGSATIEFIVVGIGVLVPLVYVVLSVMAVQSAAFASTQAVREAGRAFSTATTPAEGRARAGAAARLAFADHGLLLPSGALRIDCTEGACLAPGSAVEVTIDWQVRLPWLPSGLDAAESVSVPITAVQRVPVDDYRSSPTGA